MRSYLNVSTVVNFTRQFPTEAPSLHIYSNGGPLKTTVSRHLNVVVFSIFAVFTAGDRNSMIHESSTMIVEGVGMYLFGIYHVVIIIVLINMLIAMMSHSFEVIQVRDRLGYVFYVQQKWCNIYFYSGPC